jgi:glycosyltransferase involved in cell wall biosynthesis
MCPTVMSSNHARSTQPLVSVVTPFYNTAEHLAECIESVFRQRYDNWEYILLDNCSTDGSDEIARRYAAREPRIRLLHNDKLLPQVQNYNTALSLISQQSRYCKMVQADDWIDPQCLERMVALAESDSSIGIVSSYSLWGNRILGDGLPYATTIMSGPEICRLQLISSLFFFGSPTTVLYRSKIIHGTRSFFDPTTLHDDTDACYRILRTWKFGFVHQVLSFSRVDIGSVMSRAQESSSDLLDRLLQLQKFGPLYLEPGELLACLNDRKVSYYRFLARRFLAGNSGEFWQYHNSGLRSGDQRIEKLRLFKHVCLELLRLLANPGSTISLLRDRILARSRRQENQRAFRPQESQQRIDLPSGIPIRRDPS